METVDSSGEIAPCVRIVDDDAAVRISLARVLRAAGFCVCTYPTAQAFLEADSQTVPGCVILDLALPGQSGLDLQEALAKGDWPLPRSEEHTSELQSQSNLVCRLLLEKKN